jgi:hypothetical protein
MKVIVCTSINPPTEAISKFDAMKDWTLVVLGDLKTPENYKLKNGVYLSPRDQENLNKKLSDEIGWNCIQRRNFGFLWAFKNNAQVVAVVDDDNIPYESIWGVDLLVDKKIKSNEYISDSIAFDPISVTNYPQLWHRGFPLQLLAKRNFKNSGEQYITPKIQADFWNGDPDIDAICRLEHAPECKFDSKVFPFHSKKISPFNSQNTFISAEILKDYFLFPHVGRMDDIWAAFYIQSLGNQVVYSKASVYQDRNAHDLIKDMKNEYLGYENNLNLINDLSVNPELIKKYLPERSINAWKLYREYFE